MTNKTDGWLLTQPKRRYTPSFKTDIVKSFMTSGWVPPSQSRLDDDGIIGERVKWYDIGYNDAIEHMRGQNK